MVMGQQARNLREEDGLRICKMGSYCEDKEQYNDERLIKHHDDIQLSNGAVMGRKIGRRHCRFEVTKP